MTSGVGLRAFRDSRMPRKPDTPGAVQPGEKTNMWNSFLTPKTHILQRPSSLTHLTVEIYFQTRWMLCFIWLRFFRTWRRQFIVSEYAITEFTDLNVMVEISPWNAQTIPPISMIEAAINTVSFWERCFSFWLVALIVDTRMYLLYGDNNGSCESLCASDDANTGLNVSCFNRQHSSGSDGNCLTLNGHSINNMFFVTQCLTIQTSRHSSIVSLCIHSRSSF